MLVTLPAGPSRITPHSLASFGQKEGSEGIRALGVGGDEENRTRPPTFAIKPLRSIAWRHRSGVAAWRHLVVATLRFRAAIAQPLPRAAFVRCVRKPKFKWAVNMPMPTGSCSRRLRGAPRVAVALRLAMYCQKAQLTKVAEAFGQPPICAAGSSPNLRARTRRTPKRPAPPPLVPA
jgi:hypothetical protein